MSITDNKINTPNTTIQSLPQKPNQTMSQTQLKAKFDEFPETLRLKLNAVIDDVYNYYSTKQELLAEVAKVATGGDTIIHEEVFTIVNADLGNGTFTYTNTEGTIRTGTISGGSQVFALEKGTYQTGKSLLEITINDALRRSATSGGLTEIDTTHFGLNPKATATQKISVKYAETFELSSSIGVIEITNGEPSNPYTGRIIIDTNA